MHYKVFLSYLSDLIRAGHKWQVTDINNNTSKNPLYFSLIQFFGLAIGILLALFKPGILTGSLSEYLIAGLTIIIGLFSSYNLFIFDRYNTLKAEYLGYIQSKRPSKETKFSFKQRVNLFHQLTILSSYSILLSLICILLISINTGFETVQNPLILKLNFSFSEFLLDNVDWILLSTLRGALFYFLFDIVYIVTYMVSVSTKYMTIEYEKEV